MVNDTEARFCRALDSFKRYPEKEALFLFPYDESDNRVVGYIRQFQHSIEKLFDDGTRPCVPIRDFYASSEHLLCFLPERLFAASLLLCCRTRPNAANAEPEQPVPP